MLGLGWSEEKQGEEIRLRQVFTWVLYSGWENGVGESRDALSSACVWQWFEIKNHSIEPYCGDEKHSSSGVKPYVRKTFWTPRR